jgi:hypothetical protein
MSWARRPVLYALTAAVLALTWQALTVRYTYRGNWTALFCTGALSNPPPAALVSEHIYRFPNSYGYDGQFYHYMAHDPLLRRGFQSSLDSPRFRYRRMLVPFSAWLLVAGQDRLVDVAYFAVVFFAVFLGTWWTARIAVDRGAHPAWSLGFLFLPAVTVSLDRMTVDVALATVTAGLVYFLRRQAWGAVFVLCAAAGLVRDSGVLLPAGIVAWLALRRELGRACAIACSLLPTGAWYLYINTRTSAATLDLLSPIPFLAFARRLVTPYPYAFGTVVNVTATILDYAALAGMLVAALYCAIHWRWLFGEPEGLMAFAFLALLATVASPSVWIEAYAFARGYSPLLLLVALDGFRTRSALAIVPVALIAPRIGMQIGPQIANVARGLLGV